MIIYVACCVQYALRSPLLQESVSRFVQPSGHFLSVILLLMCSSSAPRHLIFFVFFCLLKISCF